jgi:DNA helicase-2/ATP-dependent DNA helicase PcrA
VSALSDSRDELRANDRQWEAFETTGHCVVVAPPGSGKTKLLTTKMAYDLATTIRHPHGAACITLTNAAADELHRRLEVLGVASRSTIFVGTVHSFALTRVIVPFATAAGMDELTDLKIASDRQVKALLRRAIADFYAEGERRYVDTTVLRLRKMMDEGAWNRVGGRAFEVNARYEELLRQEGWTDFDEIIRASVELVERHSFVRRTLVARYPYLYVDEYQDLAPGLDRLVQALCFGDASNATLFAVGDPFQSIYGWTGSRPELLKELSQRPGVKPVELETNYRSGSEIIRVSSDFLGEDRCVRGTREGGNVSAHYVPAGFDDQVREAAEIVEGCVAEGTPYDEIAVLCHSNIECLAAAAGLRAAGVPTFVRDNDEYRLTPATLLIESLAAWATMPRGQSGQRLGDLLRRWCSFVRGMDVHLVRYLTQTEDLASRPATSFLDEIEVLGLGQSLESLSRADDAIEVGKLRSSLAGGNLAGITVTQLADRAKALGRVHATTMTASKGLEFDVVIVLGVEQGKIPFFSSRGEDLLEDRRRFYVSLTRARDAVHIFYSGWFVWPSGSVNEDGPSQFLMELGLV